MARMLPQEAFAERVQAVLAARHGIIAERHANEGVALLLISTKLVPWFYPTFVQWQTGRENPRRPGYPAMDSASVRDGPDAIAKRIASRFHQIRTGQG
ncbi:hypothetical protein ACFHYQ_13145 [Sphaerimonospora cavernae]|uniref:Uncharacterized protein n=1 Tax=Sphaerimonospora cavernae TaxID=1740611 RepID=A0ABV6U5G5_9ACTN